MKNRWWLWIGGLGLVLASVVYLVWGRSLGCGTSDGENRSAGAIAAETDIVLEMRIETVDVERGRCSLFVSVSGPATTVVNSAGVAVPPSLDLSFFAAPDANRGGLREDALLVVGYDQRVGDESVTSVGVVTDDNHVDWMAPVSGWRELPPALTEWLVLVAPEKA